MPDNMQPDLDRIGIFKEMSYLHGVPYVSYQVAFNESAHKRKQFEYQDSKLKAGNQDGYFAKEFQRIFEGEAYTDPIRMRRRFRLESDKKNRPGIFKPSSPTKTPCGAGAIYGTFEEYNTDRIPAFSPLIREFVPVQCNRNVLVNPMQKGTGYGYPNVTISKTPPYFLEGEYEALKAREVEPPLIKMEQEGKKGVFYLPSREGEYFDENPFFTKNPMPLLREIAKPEHIKIPFIPPGATKKDGGRKGGCINPFPQYETCPYNDKILIGRTDKTVMNSSNKLFKPVPGLKPYPIYSIVDVGVKRSVNSNNCKTVKGVVYCKK